MFRILACSASLVILVGLLSPLAVAQDEIYDFDGSPDDPNFASDPNNQPYDPTDWMTSVNWNDGGADPFPPFGPSIPDLGTRVEIQRTSYGVNAPVIGPGDAAEAFGVRIGRHGGDEPGFDGTGLLTMTGGTLTLPKVCDPFNCETRLRVGNANVNDPNHRFPGTFNLSGGTVTTDTLWIGSGSHGEMIMSDGVVNTRGVFYFDWTGHNIDPFIPLHTDSVLNMTGGTINVSTFLPNAALRMYRESSLILDGGEIFVKGPAELGTQKQAPMSIQPPIAEIPNVTVSIMDGLLESEDYLQVRGSVVLTGGILRADSFNEADSTDPNTGVMGTVEINGSGLLQFNNSQESVSAVEALITAGFFTTSEASPLTVSIVDVGGTDFTQVSFAAACGTGDFDCNGIVDGRDFLLWQQDTSIGLLSDWETNYPTPLIAAVASVPEPSSVVLTLLVSVSILVGRWQFVAK